MGSTAESVDNTSSASKASSDKSKGETLNASIILAISPSSQSRSSRKALNWVLNNPLSFASWSLKIITIVAKRKSDGSAAELLKKYAAEVSSHHPKVLIESKVLSMDKHGIGHTMKAYCKVWKPTMLVVGASRDANRDKMALRDYWRTCDSYCPVMLVKTEWLAPVAGHSWCYKRVALTQNNSQHCEHAFQYVDKILNLPEPQNELVIIHAVLQKSEKDRGREFLASYGQRCQEKNFIVRSSLLLAKKYRSIQASLRAYIEQKDKECDLIICTPQPSHDATLTVTSKSKTRVGGAITSYLLCNLTIDMLFFKDDRTQALALYERGAISYKQRLSAKFRRGPPAG